MKRFIIIASIGLGLFANESKSSDATYWQQEVNYEIDVAIASDERTIDGTIKVEYINNSPDTLRELYLKAFPNAIQKYSYADKKRRSMNDYSFARLKKEQEGSLVVTDNLDQPFKIETDNTVITLYLDAPIAPTDTFSFQLDFTTVLPMPDNMRMGLKGGTSKAAYWYPQLSVYDRKFGWVNSQYIGWGECYGDFGKFDVTITAPESFVVAATGVLLNENEVLPSELREKLDITNYLKPKSEWPTFEFDESKTKTWHYLAESVNDFAFTTSKDFCIDSDSINGVEVVAYPLKNKAKSWINAVKYGKESIVTFSEKFYPYAWPVIRICDAFSGMEYPMITNCGGGEPNSRLALLIYHEIGHQWFMGQVGNNQLDRPFLDEGFTTHLEHVAMEKYFGREGNYDIIKNNYQRKFAPKKEDRNQRGFYPLLDLIRNDYDKPMAFSYDQGEEYWTHRVSAYYKSAAMHYSLRSILGDSAYFEAMHHYCEKWFFKHPYEEDFTQAIEEATNIELDAYLEQWYYSRKKLDYAFGKMSRKKIGRKYNYDIEIKRLGEFVSPIDIAVIWKQGDTTFYTVSPEGMNYTKPGFVQLPTWNQFRRLESKYTFEVQAERKISKVVIDPFDLLVDVNRMNNSSSMFPPIEFRLDNMKYDRTPVNKYALRMRPDLWYNDISGLQVGFHWHGSYFETSNKFSLDLRRGLEDNRKSFDYRYSNPSDVLGENSKIAYRILSTDFRSYFEISFEKRFKPLYSRPDRKIFQLLLSHFASNRYYPQYLYGQAWDSKSVYAMQLSLAQLKTFRYGFYRVSSSIKLGLLENHGTEERFTIFENDIDLTFTRNNKPFIHISQSIFSANEDLPFQEVPQLSRLSSMKSFLNSPLFQSPGTFPKKWGNKFFPAGGVVRGYHDRPIYFKNAVALSVELIPSKIWPMYFLKRLPLIGSWLNKSTHSFFLDFAIIDMDQRSSLDSLVNPFYAPTFLYNEKINGSASNSRLFGDQGFMSAGVSFTPPAIWSGHYLRIDFPLYLRKPFSGDKKYKFRVAAAWVMPIK